MSILFLQNSAQLSYVALIRWQPSDEDLQIICCLCRLIAGRVGTRSLRRGLLRPMPVPTRRNVFAPPLGFTSQNALHLFLGPNGSGKTSVFNALWKIESLANGDGKVDQLFPASERTAGRNNRSGSLNWNWKGTAEPISMSLAIDHDPERLKNRVKHERLWFDGKPLLKVELGEVQLCRDNHSQGPSYTFDWTQSVLPTILPRPDSSRLIWFKERLQRFIIIQITPTLMSVESSEEAARLSRRMENFVSWYRFLSADQGKIFELTQVLSWKGGPGTP